MDINLVKEVIITEQHHSGIWIELSELVGILKDLGAISPDNFIEISVLTKYFYDLYGQPIKPVLNALISGLKLVEFLQCSDFFVVLKVDDKWKVALK